MNDWKQELYEKAQIGIPHQDRECNDLIILGFMIAQFIADFRWQLSRTDVQCRDGTFCQCNNSAELNECDSSVPPQVREDSEEWVCVRCWAALGSSDQSPVTLCILNMNTALVTSEILIYNITIIIKID